MFRFGLPSSAGLSGTQLGLLERYLTVLSGPTEILSFASYDELLRALTNGRLDAAWSPPFVCARAEVMGMQVLVQCIRGGSSTYRAALLMRKSAVISVEALRGKNAAWTDPDSVAGYLLPMSWFRAQRRSPSGLFAKQEFVGTYRAGLAAVLEGTAAVTSIYASAPESENDASVPGLEAVWPEQRQSFRVLGLSADAPNDGVTAGRDLSARTRDNLRQLFLTLQQTPLGVALL